MQVAELFATRVGSIGVMLKTSEQMELKYFLVRGRIFRQDTYIKTSAYYCQRSL